MAEPSDFNAMNLADHKNICSNVEDQYMISKRIFENFASENR